MRQTRLKTVQRLKTAALHVYHPRRGMQRKIFGCRLHSPHGSTNPSLTCRCQQPPVIEQALETAARMLGSDKSRGYCLEMICADFLAGANLDNDNPDVLLMSLTRFFEFLPAPQQQQFLREIRAA